MEPAGFGLTRLVSVSPSKRGVISGMARTFPFDNFTERYDAWFDRHVALYRLELEAVRRFFPSAGPCLEIGVGSGRFAGPLGIDFGVEPSIKMAAKARERGVMVAIGTAEALPVKTSSMKGVLMVTTICFVDDIRASFAEVNRVLCPGGSVVVGLVDRDSWLGRKYMARKEQNVFYRHATFYSSSEVLELLAGSGFEGMSCLQTILPGREQGAIEPGTGKGGFVVIRARKAFPAAGAGQA